MYGQPVSSSLITGAAQRVLECTTIRSGGTDTQSYRKCLLQRMPPVLLQRFAQGEVLWLLFSTLSILVYPHFLKFGKLCSSAFLDHRDSQAMKADLSLSNFLLKRTYTVF